MSIVFTNRDGIHFINRGTIVFIKCEGSSSAIKLDDETELKISRNSKYLMELFANPYFLFRIHRSWIINIRLIKGIYSKAEYNSKVGLFGRRLLFAYCAHPKKILLEKMSKTSIKSK